MGPAPWLAFSLPSSNGVIVNAPAGDTVILRDISINGACNGINGIRYLAGKTLMVEHCWIYDFTNNGIDVSKTADGMLKVLDTVIENCTLDGIVIATTAGQVRGTIDRSRMMNCGNGLHAKNNSRVSANGCFLAGNSGVGVFAEGVGGVAVANMSRSAIYNNGGAGVQAGGGGSSSTSIVRISDCDLMQNAGTGALVSTNGEIDTWQNNRIFGNGTDGCPSCQLKNPN